MLELTKDLYAAPFALLYHSFFVVEEPTFMYANKVLRRIKLASKDALHKGPLHGSISCMAPRAAPLRGKG